MNRNDNIAYRIWEIMYPVLMYYATLSIASFVAQTVIGTGVENYMLCKTIGSLVTIPVVYADYKKDLMLTGRYGLKNPWEKSELKNLGFVFVSTICLSVALNNIICMSPLVQMSEEFQNASDAFYGSSMLIELLGAAVVTPILEELLHRGVVYGRLRRRMGMWSAVIVSALVFAVLHFNVVQFVYAFLMGIVFALIVEKTGRLFFAIFAHIVANAIAVVRTETGFLEGTVDGSVSAWFISVGLCLLGIALFFAFVGNKKEEDHE